MSNAKVTVIDYGMGNIFSVARALETCGAEVILTESSEDILSAERLILPGVGAFQDGMQELRSRGYVEAIRQYARLGRPLLGICLGMQMLMDRSSEFGDHEGLGLIVGNVVQIPSTTTQGDNHKIPHIGWSELQRPDHVSWEGTLLDGVAENSCGYFVHSFTCEPEHEDNRLSDATYNGRRISAAVRSGSIYGCQFHPEKSAQVGLQIVRNFVTLDL